MYRWPDLADFLGWELLGVAMAMEDGSYWNGRDDGRAQDHSSDPADWG